MDAIISKKLPIRHELVSREEARARITKLGEPYKLEVLVCSRMLTYAYVC